MQRRIALLLLPLLLLPGCVGLDRASDPPADQDATVQTATTDDEPAPSADASPRPAANSSSAPAPTPGSAASTNTNATPAASNEAAQAPTPRVDVLWWNATTTSAGLGAVEPQPGFCCIVATAPEEGWTRFNVPEGAKGVVVELIWTDDAVDLDLRVSAADYTAADPQSGALTTGHAWSADEGMPSQPDGHATILVTESEALAAAGEWGWEVFGKGAAPATAFQIVASVFLDEAPADGYTAPAA